MEHLLLEDFVPSMTIRRLKVPRQPDDQSCGWRTCLNALLLIKNVYDIADVSDMYAAHFSFVLA